jgi:hypothetical protein
MDSINLNSSISILSILPRISKKQIQRTKMQNTIKELNKKHYEKAS